MPKFIKVWVITICETHYLKFQVAIIMRIAIHLWIYRIITRVLFNLAE